MEDYFKEIQQSVVKLEVAFQIFDGLEDLGW